MHTMSVSFQVLPFKTAFVEKRSRFVKTHQNRRVVFVMLLFEVLPFIDDMLWKQHDPQCFSFKF